MVQIPHFVLNKSIFKLIDKFNLQFIVYNVMDKIKNSFGKLQRNY